MKSRTVLLAAILVTLVASTAGVLTMGKASPPAEKTAVISQGQETVNEVDLTSVKEDGGSCAESPTEFPGPPEAYCKACRPDMPCQGVGQACSTADPRCTCKSTKVGLLCCR